MALIPYIIKSFRGGVSDENDKGVPGSFKHGYSLNIHKRNDSLSCGSTMVTVLGESAGILGSNTGTTMTGIFNVLLPISDGSLLAFSDMGSIWSRSGDGQWVFRYNDPAGKIIGAGEWEDDDGNNYIIWATQTQISRKLYPGSATAAIDTGTSRWADVTNEWKTESISSNATWHTMKPAAGNMYIANSDYISEISFTDFDWDPLAMTVRPGNRINCLEERNDYLIMGSEREDGAEEGHIFSWTPIATNWVEKKKIPVPGVNALVYTELPLLQGGDRGELFFSDFQNVVPLNAIPGNGQCTPHGASIEDDLAVFGIYGGTTVSYPGIWSYGRKRKNRPLALNYNYRLSPTVNGSTISSLSAVAVLHGILMASWGTEDSHTSGTTSEYGIDEVSTTTAATAIYEGLEFDAGRPFENKYIDIIKVTTSPLPASTSYSIRFKTDKETDWRYAVLGTGSTTYSETDSISSEWQVSKPGAVLEIGIELNPSGESSPEILSVTAYLDDKRYEHP